MAGMAECRESLWSGVWAASGPFLEQLHSKLRVAIMGSGLPGLEGGCHTAAFSGWVCEALGPHGLALFFSVTCLDSKCETLFEKTTSNCDCLFMPVCFFEMVGETSEVVPTGLALESSHLRVAGFTGVSHCLALISDISY